MMIRIRYYLVRFLAGLAGLLLWGAAGAAPNEWPPAPSLMELDTPYGILHIQTSEYVYESRLLVGQEQIKADPPIQGILNITYAYSLPHSQAALISISSGNTECPVTYRWVLLSEKGHKVSEPFGSCSTRIKVSAEGRKFTVRTPSVKKPDKMDIYVYDGKKIRHRIKP